MAAPVPPAIPQGSADLEIQRKRRVADDLIEKFLSIECELQGTPYIRVEITSDQGHYELMVGRRRRFKVKAA